MEGLIYDKRSSKVESLWTLQSDKKQRKAIERIKIKQRKENEKKYK